MNNRLELLRNFTCALLACLPFIGFSQIPAITHLQPGSAIAGQVITIRGANFQPIAGNNTVTFDGSPATVNSATTTTLKVDVPLATAGPANLRVSTVGGTSPDLTNFTIIATNAGGSMANAAYYDIGNPVRTLATGDLNNDGIIDIISTDANSFSFILTGNGDGTFSDGPNLGTGSTSTGITLADFNKDGLLDIAVANSLVSGTVSIRLNSGGGSFASAVGYSAGSFPVWIRSGDFNLDGNIDLVTANYVGDNVSVLLGSGTGTFGAPTNFTVGNGPGFLAIGDYNGDNIVDLAVTNSSDDNVSILIGSGTGSFASAVNYGVGNNPQGIVVGFFNSDAVPDLAIANDYDDNVSMLLGVGDGTFGTATNFTVSDSPKEIVAVDINGDGLVDVVTSNGGGVGSPDKASVLISNGDGTFKTVKIFSAGPDPMAVASADFNNDGRMDLVVGGNHGTNNISILLNNDPLVNTSTSITSIDPPFGITDQEITIHGSAFDNTPSNNTVTFDGLPATVISASQFKLVAKVPMSAPGLAIVLVSNGNGTSSSPSNFFGLTPNQGGTFASFVNYTAGDAPRGTAAGDFNEDGNIDLAVPNSTDNNVKILIGNGTDTFIAGNASAVGSSPYAIVAADFNNDGHLDLSTVHFGTNQLSILLGIGDGTFQSFTTSSTGGGSISLVAADFDLNGYIDLATANLGADNLSILLSNGDGTFGTPTNFAVGDQPEGIIEGDFNGDGYPDLATANLFSNNISVLINNGDGTFGAASSYSIGGQGKEIAAGDFDNDGDLDLVAANFSSSNVSVFLGNGNGTFSTAIQYAAGNQPEAVTIGDFNNDGNLDIVTDNVALLPGNGDGTFAAPTQLTVEGSATSITAADFNNDGMIDLATANWFTDNISVLMNRAKPTVIDVIPSSAKPGAILTISGHQFNAVPLSNTVTIGGISATVNSGNTTSLKVTMPTGVVGPSSIVVTNSFGVSQDPIFVNALKSDSGGGFRPVVYYTASSIPAGVTVGDFDGNGTTDVATANDFIGTGSADVILGNGDGTLNVFTNFATGSASRSIVSADVNRDQKLDLATSNDGSADISMMIGIGDGTFAAPLTYSVGTGPSKSAKGDFNNDGLIDIVTANRQGNSISILLGYGNGGFATATNIIVSSGPQGILAGDFNNDGNTDIAVNLSGIDNVGILLGNGDGTFMPVNNYATGDQPLDFAMGDFNEDGLLDIVNVYFGTDQLSVLLGIGSGAFATPSFHPTGDGPFKATVGDFNGDGHLDIATGNVVKTSILFGLGDGTFQPFKDFNLAGASDIDVADFDQDGLLDLIVTGGSSFANVQVLLGANTGTDILTFSLPQQTGPATIDVNNKTVAIEVTAGTLVNSLTPTISASPGASILPNSGVARNFTNPVTYTVTADDQTTAKNWTVTVVAVPGAPAMSLVNTEQTTAEINWNVPAFTESFELELSTQSDFSILLSGYNPKTLNKTTLLESFSGLSAGTQYYCRIRALNINSSASVYSNVIQFLTKPNTPVLNSISNSEIDQTSFLIGWSLVPGIADDYQVEVSSTDFSITTTLLMGYPLTVVSNSINVGVDAGTSPLAPGTMYWVRIRSRNSSGESPESNVLIVLTKAATPVLNSTSPLDITQTTSLISWNGVTGMIDNYNIEVSSTDFTITTTLISGYPLQVSSSTTSLILGVDAGTNSLTPGTNYWVRINAENNSGQSPYSNAIQILTEPNTPTLNPVIPANIAQTNFTIEWASVAGLVDGYVIEVSSTDFAQSTTLLPDYPLTITANSITIGVDAGTSALTPGTNYWVRVHSTNASGESPLSNVIPILTKPATPLLSNVLTQEITQFTARISWMAVSGLTDNYLIDVSSTDFSFTTTLLPGYPLSVDNSTTALVIGNDFGTSTLSPGTNYWVRVRSKNTTGESLNSNVASLLTIPSEPTATSASSITQVSFQATWTAVTGGSFYLVDVSADDFSTFILQDENVTGALFLDIVGLMPNTQYKYRVRAGNATGQSSYSNVVSAITQGGGASPLNFGAVNYGNSITTPPGSASINVSVAGGTGVYTAVLRHQGILGGGFQSITMTETSIGVFDVTLTSDLFDELGVEFDIEVNDGITSISDTGNRIFWAFNDAQSSSIPFASFGGKLENWNLFSIPFQLEDNLIQSVFDEMGSTPYLTQWRLMQYKNAGNGDGDYVDSGSGINRLEVGKGYWFNAIADVVVKIGAGSVTSSIPFTMNLQQGWNQIGNPYNIPISWNKVLSDNGNPPTVASLQTFSGITQSTGDVIEPFKGAFVWSDANESIIIDPRTVKSSGKVAANPNEIAENNLDGDTWKIDLSLQYGKIHEHLGGFGMHPNALVNKDPFDHLALPRFIFFSDLYSLHQQEQYPWFATDIVPTAPKHVWAFNLSSNKTNEPALLTWNMAALESYSANLLLVDKSNGTLVDMKTQPSYQVNLAQGDLQFEVHYLSPGETFEPTTLILGHAYPNPATSKAIIPVMIPPDIAEVGFRLSIHDVMGREIKVLANGKYKSGLQEFVWEIPVDVNGLFIYRLSSQYSKISYQGKIIVR